MENYLGGEEFSTVVQESHVEFICAIFRNLTIDRFLCNSAITFITKHFKMRLNQPIFEKFKRY